MQKWSPCTSTVSLHREFTLYPAARGFYLKGTFDNAISLYYKQNQLPRTKSYEGSPSSTHLGPAPAPRCSVCSSYAVFAFFSRLSHIPLQGIYTCCNSLSSFYTVLSSMAVFPSSVLFSLKCHQLLRQVFPDNSILTALLITLEPTQFSHSVTSNSLRPHEPQHARPPCLSPTPGVHPNPCPLSQ